MHLVSKLLREVADGLWVDPTQVAAVEDSSPGLLIHLSSGQSIEVPVPTGWSHDDALNELLTRLSTADALVVTLPVPSDVGACSQTAADERTAQ